MVRRRELPGFGISIERYRKAEEIIVAERKLNNLRPDVPVQLYLESLLMAAIGVREKELSKPV